MNTFIDRKQAGEILASLLQKEYANRADVVVLALPRGGVPVAYEIARSLSIPLDLCIVRKLGVPKREELAMGAIGSAGVVVLNQELIQQLQISQSAVDQVIQLEQAELLRRESLYGRKKSCLLKDKKIILVDDGIATGATMQAAIMTLGQQDPAKIIVAVPVAARDSYEQIKKSVDQIICPLIPIHFVAVGSWYENFSQTSDAEVCALLESVGI